MLAEFAHWWMSQMRALAPGLLARARLPEDALSIAFDGPATGIEQAPAGAVLRREVVLPLAAGRDLTAVLGFEMDRLTPFAADEVYWSVSRLSHDRARTKLKLTLSIALRAQVDSLRTAIGRINVTPNFIETETGRLPLGTPGRQPGWRPQQTLFALYGVLALACLAPPFLHQQMALDAAAQKVADVTPEANRAQGRTAIAAARHAGDALQVLSLLTAALPDDTWLSDLTLKSGDLAFDGQSSNAAQLINLLSAVPGLRNPSFTAPATRTSDGKADLFSLHVTAAE